MVDEITAKTFYSLERHKTYHPIVVIDPIASVKWFGPKVLHVPSIYLSTNL